MRKDLLESIRNISVLAEDLQIKATKGLLEDSVADKFEDDFYDLFATTANLNELDEESQLEFKKHFATKLTRWKKVTHSVFNFVSAEEGLRIINYRKEFIDNVLKRNHVNLPNTGFIQIGKPYAARELLRDIISNASNEVWLIDRYFHPNILRLLSEIKDENSQIKFKILTHDVKNSQLTNLKNSLSLFLLQYPNAIIEAKAGKIMHDRYLVVDNIKLFHFGLSFHDLGISGDSSWSEKKEPTEINQTLTAISQYFNNGITII